MNALELWMEGDSLTVIQWLWKNPGNTWLLHPLLQDLQSQKHEFQLLRITHVFCEKNRAADFLATKVRVADFDIYSNDQLHPALAAILWAAIFGDTFGRMMMLKGKEMLIFMYL